MNQPPIDNGHVAPGCQLFASKPVPKGWKFSDAEKLNWLEKNIPSHGRLLELEHENARLREVGDRMAAMLELGADAPVEEWPDDEKIMSVLSDWRSSPNTRICPTEK